MREVFVVYVIRKAGPVLKGEFALVIGKLLRSDNAHLVVPSNPLLTMEFVNVAGTATVIHHTKPVRKSFPRPLTKLLTNLPSNSATYRLIIVLNTKNTL